MLFAGAVVGMNAGGETPARRAAVEGSVEPTSTTTSIAEPTPLAPIGGLAPSVLMVPRRVYVPNGKSDTVSEIDPTTRTVVRTFKVGKEPQHIVPAYDLSRLWVLDNSSGDLVPIDPIPGNPGPPVKVKDPYNLYFTPDGVDAIVVAEQQRRLDLRDPITMALQRSIDVPTCDGINHIDYPGDGSYLIATCEFAGRLAKIDWRSGRVVDVMDLPRDPTDGSVAMPQDIRVGADGHTFYVADMMRGGLYVLDGDTMTVEGFIPTGIGTHGITPARDGRVVYVVEPWLAGNQGTTPRSGIRVDRRRRLPTGDRQLAGARRREPGHGQPQHRRQRAVALGSLRQRGVRVRPGPRRHRGAHRGRQGPARHDLLAAARPLLAGPHGQHALIAGQGVEAQGVETEKKSRDSGVGPR